MKYKKKEIKSARKMITRAFEEGWVEIGEYGLRLTPSGIKQRDQFTRAMLDRVFEMAVTV